MTRSSKGTSQLSSAVVPPVVLIAASWATIGVAQAQDFCASIDALIDQSPAQFAEIIEDPNGDAGEYDVTLSLAGASYCLVTKRSKRSSYHCGWEFPYRAEQAYETFDAFVGEVNDCIGQHATLHSDQSVNHPDYYALRRFEMEQADVSVSVKDKSALSRTLVFIRIQATKSNELGSVE